MVAAHSLPDLVPAPPDDGEQRLILHGVTYKDYVLMSDVLGHRPGLHLTFLEGTLEIMTTSRRHENYKKLIARLLELHALVRGVRISGFGSTTYRREDLERGLEPDECYCVDTDKEFPDLALEVVVTSGGLQKLPVYEGLGVREVWIFEGGKFALYSLAEGGYELRDRSAFFPEMDFDELARYTMMGGQDAAVRAYWDALRARP